jgi:hypothetical protein
MEQVQKLLAIFTRITTLSVLGTAIFISIFWKGVSLSVAILWQILFVSLLCSVSALPLLKEAKTKKQLIIRNVVTYLYVNLVVMSCGYIFGWYLWEQLPMVLGMLLLILFVTLAVSFIPYHKEKELADKMTEKLARRRSNHSSNSEKPAERQSNTSSN